MDGVRLMSMPDVLRGRDTVNTKNTYEVKIRETVRRVEYAETKLSFTE